MPDARGLTMKKFTLAIIYLYTISLSLIGCGNDKPSFSLLPTSNTFLQSGNVVNNKIDVLWVVDNSGSMYTSQTNLANNFQAFITNFTDKGYDFQIAVTTTDAYKAIFQSNPDLSKFKDGNGASHSEVFVITPDTPNIVDTFVTNITQGIYGSGDERAFQSFREALNNSLNAGFIRENSYLSVIIVSDEDDFSWDQSTPHAYGDYTEGPGHLHYVEEYVDYLMGITNSTVNQKRFNVNGIYITDQACADTLHRPIGIRYQEIVNLTDGIEGSICDTSFADSLNLIAEKIVASSVQFYLDQLPVVETIVISIDGQIITSGWTYDATSNSIIFDASVAPAQGSVLNVDFDPAAF